MKRKRSVGHILFYALLTMLFVLSVGVPVSAQAAVTMDKSSITIQTGDTYQLTVLVDGKTANAANWKSSDASVATVSGSGVVTAKGAGSAVITATAEGTTVECLVSVVEKSDTGTVRYNVLILDTSGSMSGKPLKREKGAAKRFCKTVLESDGTNYLAVMTLNSSSNVLCGFTNDLNKLNKCISSVKSGGGTNMNAALQKAGSLLAKAQNGANVMKNVILCSDGLPKTGAAQASGRYKASDHSYYQYANAAYKTDVSLKSKKYFVYALGFFHNSDSKDLKFGKKLMKDLASKNKYYVVMNTKDIDNVFKNVAKKITNTTITKKSVTLYVGGTYKLGVQVNGVTKKAKWESSKSGVASVNSSGKVTAKKVGKATITGTVNGKSVTCKVTVKKKKAASKPANNPSGVKKNIRLNYSKAGVYVRKTLQLKATVTGAGKKVKWKSSNPKIATVNQNGKVTGKKSGKVTITATANGVKASCVVTVSVKHPTYSFYMMHKPIKSIYGKIVDEQGIMLKVNQGAKIKRCGAYIYKYGDYTYVTIACSGTNLTSAYLSVYKGRNGKILYQGGHKVEVNGREYMLNTFTMSRDNDGIWSPDGNYDSIKMNMFTSSGKEIAPKSIGVAGKHMKLFYNKEKFLKWLKKKINVK